MTCVILKVKQNVYIFEWKHHGKHFTRLVYHGDEEGVFEMVMHNYFKTESNNE